MPEAVGGLDVLTNLVSLCDDCHSKVHGAKAVDLSALTKAALAAAKARGVVVGRPSIDKDRQDLIRRLRADGMSYREVAEASGVNLASAFKYGR